MLPALPGYFFATVSTRPTSFLGQTVTARSCLFCGEVRGNQLDHLGPMQHRIRLTEEITLAVLFDTRAQTQLALFHRLNVCSFTLCFRKIATEVNQSICNVK